MNTKKGEEFIFRLSINKVSYDSKKNFELLAEQEFSFSQNVSIFKDKFNISNDGKVISLVVLNKNGKLAQCLAFNSQDLSRFSSGIINLEPLNIHCNLYFLTCVV